MVNEGFSLIEILWVLGFTMFGAVFAFLYGQNIGFGLSIGIFLGGAYAILWHHSGKINEFEKKIEKLEKL